MKQRIPMPFLLAMLTLFCTALFAGTTAYADSPFQGEQGYLLDDEFVRLSYVNAAVPEPVGKYCVYHVGRSERGYADLTVT